MGILKEMLEKVAWGEDAGNPWEFASRRGSITRMPSRTAGLPEATVASPAAAPVTTSVAQVRPRPRKVAVADQGVFNRMRSIGVTPTPTQTLNMDPVVVTAQRPNTATAAARPRRSTPRPTVAAQQPAPQTMLPPADARPSLFSLAPRQSAQNTQVAAQPVRAPVTTQAVPAEGMAFPGSTFTANRRPRSVAVQQFQGAPKSIPAPAGAQGLEFPGTAFNVQRTAPRVVHTLNSGNPVAFNTTEALPKTMAAVRSGTGAVVRSGGGMLGRTLSIIR